MIPIRLIVEDEVLKLAPLNGHEHGAMGSGDRVITRIFRNLSLIPPLGQVSRRRRNLGTGTRRGALFCALAYEVTCRHESHGLHWTDVTHLPQPLHESALTSGRKLVVAMGFRTAKRLQRA